MSLCRYIGISICRYGDLLVYRDMSIGYIDISVDAGYWRIYRYLGILIFRQDDIFVVCRYIGISVYRYIDRSIDRYIDMSICLTEKYICRMSIYRNIGISVYRYVDRSICR